MGVGFLNGLGVAPPRGGGERPRRGMRKGKERDAAHREHARRRVTITERIRALCYPRV